jgi:hypothetical protein
MTLVRRYLSIAVVGSVALIAGADDPPTKKGTPEPPESAEVRMADGSVVRMLLTQSDVDITTRYGKLSVPVADIRRIEFGFRYPAGAEERIHTAIDKLTLTNAKDREAASEELVGYGAIAYPALKRIAAGTDTEISTRARAVMRKIEEKLGADKLKSRDQDVIHTTEFVVAGRIEAPTLKGRTTYFGEVAVQVSEVRTIRFLGGTGVETELSIDAAKYAAITRDVWLDTEVDVNEGATLQIQAAGIVDLYPSGGNYKVGPDAMPRQGQAPDGTPSGMLVGRIGSNGKPFQVGAKYSGNVAESGRLYLRIESSPWNNASTGGYAVKIIPNADGGGVSIPMAPIKKPSKKEFKK